MTNVLDPSPGNHHAEPDDPSDHFASAAATGTYASTRPAGCQCRPDSGLPRARQLALRRRPGARVIVARCMVIHDQARATLPRQVGPDPLQKHTDPKARLPYEFEVHGRPRQPREKAAHVDSPALQDGAPLSHYRHVALVEVPERSRGGLSSDTSVNQPPRIAPLLHRHLGDAGQRLAILVERCGITDHEDLPVPGHREVGLDPYTAGAIRLALH